MVVTREGLMGITCVRAGSEPARTTSQRECMEVLNQIRPILDKLTWVFNPGCGQQILNPESPILQHFQFANQSF
jgi:hypothetical protein